MSLVTNEVKELSLTIARYIAFLWWLLIAAPKLITSKLYQGLRPIYTCDVSPTISLCNGILNFQGAKISSEDLIALRRSEIRKVSISVIATQ